MIFSTAKRCLALFLACAAMAAAGAAAADTTYTYTVGNYTNKSDYTSCTVGPCANYTLSQTLTGSFSTASPLAANLTNSHVTPTSFNFNDGINTYASTDPDVRNYSFAISTDGSGNITSTDIVFERWLSGTSPHTIANRFSYLQLFPTGVTAYNNQACNSVGTSSYTGAADSCTTYGMTDTSGSIAFVAVGTWSGMTPPTPTPSAVPTLGEWAIILLGMILGGLGFAWTLTRRSANPTAA